MSRIDALHQFLEEDPNDSFSRYALAMEYAKLDRFDEALAEFNRVVVNDPDYVATYYQLGKLLEKLGRSGEAREIFRAGIAVATRHGENHTREELEAAMDMLGD